MSVAGNGSDTGDSKVKERDALTKASLVQEGDNKGAEAGVDVERNFIAQG